MEYKPGDKIIITDNAFEGSDNEEDFEWRGRAAEVVSVEGDGCYEVYAEGFGYCLLIDKEMKLKA